MTEPRSFTRQQHRFESLQRGSVARDDAMANFNKVILVGRLTREPETRSFASGGMVAKFGFAVTNRKKNSQTGQWEDEPMFIDCEVYNRGEFGRLADLVRDRCRKGTQIMIEGRLHLDTWQDKATGQNRSKHKIVVESVQLLEPRADGMGGGGGGGGGGMNRGQSSGSGYSDEPAGMDDHGGGMPDNSGSDIPF